MSEMSKSKQKRIEQEKNRNKQRQQKALRTFWSIFIPLLIVAAIVGAVIYYRMSQLDYSRYLTKEGTVSNIKASDYVSVDTQAMSFSKAELLPDDSEIESEIASELSSHQYISDDASLESDYGDRVSITYTSTIDGEEYVNVTEATDYTIGDSEINEEFDDALVGHLAGDSFVASVSFADDYEDEAAAGKTAEYKITLEGIYTEPEFDDAYVQQYHSDTASTAEEYRQSLIDAHYDKNLRTAIDESLSMNSVVKSLPDNYVAQVERILKENDIQQMEYMNSMYQQMMGYAPYTNVYEMGQFADQAAYEADLNVRAKEAVSKSLELQFIYEQAVLSVSEADVTAFYNEQGYDNETLESMKKEYGEGYMAQSVFNNKVMDYLVQTVNVSE